MSATTGLTTGGSAGGTTGGTVESHQAPASTALGGFVNLLRSEWTKLRSVRSTLWALILLVVLSVGFTTLLVELTVAQWDQLDRGQRASLVADPVASILGSGFQFSQLAVCVLGVIVMTSEYSTGTIRASLLATPRRSPVLVAKAIVFAAVVFIVSEVAAMLCFVVGAAILHPKIAVSIGDPGVARAVLGAGLYGAVLGVFALGVGTLVRHTAPAITGIIGFVLVLSPLALLLPGSVGKHIHAYLPTVAGQQIVTTYQTADAFLSPWQGFGVFCAWTVLLLLVAGYGLKRRDA